MRRRRREKAKRAAHLSKADLLTEVVGEFPELQGLMGKYYAEEQGEDEAVRMRSRIITTQGAGAISCPRILFQSRSRSRIRSTRWSVFGRSVKSRPEAKIPMRCAGQL